MANACVALAPTPLAAVRLPANVPAALGVPLITPPEVIARPVGNDPASAETTGGGEPLVSTRKLYGTPSAPFAGGALTNAGACCAAATLVNENATLAEPEPAWTLKAP